MNKCTDENCWVCDGYEPFDYGNTSDISFAEVVDEVLHRFKVAFEKLRNL